MYGAIACMRVKAGAEDQLVRVLLDIAQHAIPGFVRAVVHRAAADPRELFLTLAFDSQAAYEANAASPEQDARLPDVGAGRGRAGMARRRDFRRA